MEEGNVQLNTYPSSTPINLNGSAPISNGNHAAAREPADANLREVDFAKVSISEALSVLKVRLHTEPVDELLRGGQWCSRLSAEVLQRLTEVHTGLWLCDKPGS